MFYESEKHVRKSSFKTIRRRADTKVAFVGHGCGVGAPRGVGPVPVKKMLDEASKQMAVLIVDEHRTSITCSSCCSREKMEKPKREQLKSRCECGARYRDKCQQVSQM